MAAVRQDQMEDMLESARFSALVSSNVDVKASFDKYGVADYLRKRNHACNKARQEINAMQDELVLQELSAMGAELEELADPGHYKLPELID